jgi:hypothetical protein
MTDDEPKTKPFGKFRIPPNCVDRTAQRVGRPIAIIGGISPTQVKTPPQDGEQLERDDDKADERDPEL